MYDDMLGKCTRLLDKLPDEASGTVFDLLEKLASKNGQVWLEATKRFLREDPCYRLKGVPVPLANSFITHNFTLDVKERCLEDAIAAGKYYYCGYSEMKKYPLTDETYGLKQMAIFHFNGMNSCQEEKAKKEMDEAGYRSATLMELLALGEKYPDLQREFPIVAMGSSFWGYKGLFVPTLGDGPRGRALEHQDISVGLGSKHRFLAVKK